MIKLATCFSGIGAIEHALNRMGIDNKIVFACDNGDVDILTKDVPLDIKKMREEFKNLEKIINQIEEDEYKCELKKDLLRDDKLFDKQIHGLSEVLISDSENVNQILNKVIKMDNVKAARIKEYNKFIAQLSIIKNDELNYKLHILSYAVEILNDFHKDNTWDLLSVEDSVYSSVDNIDWYIIRTEVIRLKNFIDRL